MKKIIGGNWKESGNGDTFKMLSELKEEQFQGLEAFVAVPSIYIARACREFPAYLSTAAQDVSTYADGAYTGEVSAGMLKEHAVKYVIIGHSERRIHFGEEDSDIAQKLRRCLEYGLCAVLCIGETAECRNTGQHRAFLYNELKASVGGSHKVEVDIAYEPIWAIGGSREIDIEQIKEITQEIRKWMVDLEITGRVLYGGSVNIKNIRQIINIESVDGVLVGNAALSSEFGEIASNMH